MRMRLVAAVALVGAALLMAADSGKGTPLFNGKDLSGWNGDPKVFRVEDGAIVGGSLKAPLDHNEFLASDAAFGDFELTLKFKITGDPQRANAGIQFRSERVPNDREMSGYQADIGQEYWGCLYDESRRNKVLVKPDPAVLAKAMKPDDWNDYRIRAEGPHIQLWLNGVQTVDYTEKESGIAARGRFGLQVHAGPPMEVRYKDLRIAELK